MAPRARNRSRNVTPAGEQAPLARLSANPVLRLQGAIGNRAAGQVLAREAAKGQGTVSITKLPVIKMDGGNAGDWAAKKDVETLEVKSTKGKHSSKLAQLAKERTRIESLKMTTPKVDGSGKHLDFGSVEVEFSGGRITSYSIDGDVETWTAGDFKAIHRTTTSRKIGSK